MQQCQISHHRLRQQPRLRYLLVLPLRTKLGRQRVLPLPPQTHIDVPVTWKTQAPANVFDGQSLFDQSTLSSRRQTISAPNGRSQLISTAYGRVDMEVHTPERGWVKFKLEPAYFVPSY